MPSGRQLFTSHFSLLTLHFLLSPSGESVGGQTKKNCQRCERWQFFVYIKYQMFRSGEKRNLFFVSFYFAGASAGVSAAPEAGKEGTF